MPRVWLIVAFGLVQLYAFVESIVEPGPRLMPRAAWVLITGFVPVIGMVMWFALGRPRRNGFRRPQGPDDDTDFLKSI
jgi:hypothetical protein